MDFKIRGIELVKKTLTWLHTAFKHRDSAKFFHRSRKRKFKSKEDKPPPAQQNPIAPLNVSFFGRTAGFVSCHKVCCFLYFHHRLIHCRSPPSCLNSSKIQIERRKQFRGNER